MRTRILLILAALAAPALGQEAQTSISETIERAIAGYQRAWLPKQKELNKLVVVVDPADLGSEREALFSLQAAGHLLHLIQRGGGVPVLTRVDEAPAPDCVNGSAVALATHAKRSRCHLAIRLVSQERSDAPLPASREDGALPPSTKPEARRLANLVAFSLGDGATAGIVGTAASPPIETPVVTMSLLMPPASADALATRKAGRDQAERIYHGLSAFAIAQRPALDACRGAVPEGDPATSQPVPLHTPQMPRPEKMRLAARQICPEGALPPSRAAWYCDLHRKVLMSDTTVVYFEPQVSVSGDSVTLTGATENSLLPLGLLTSLQSLGITRVDNRVRLLPDESRLDGRLFGACRAMMVRTFKKPEETSTPMTQIFYGEPLFLLDREAGFYLVHSSEGYIGWVRERAVQPMILEQFREYAGARTAVLLKDLELPEGILRTGSRLQIGSEQGGSIAIRRPEGGVLQISANQLHVIDHTAQTERRVRAALDLLYTPYVFGARSTIGLDCSGLTGSTLERIGASPPRDAAQQFLSGKLVATRWYREDMRLGDLIYFIDESGKIFHTGMALSATHFIHSSSPEVQISCWTKGDRLYESRWDERFLAAKRP